MYTHKSLAFAALSAALWHILPAAAQRTGTAVGQIFTGCRSTRTNASGSLTTTATNPQTCIATCRSNSPTTHYVFYRSSDSECHCTSSTLASSNNVALGTYSGTTDACAFDDYTTYYYDTAFSRYADGGFCRAGGSITPANGWTTVGGRVDACTNQCISYTFAYWEALSNGNFRCGCGNGGNGENTARVRCDQGTVFVYAKTQIAAASPIARRRLPRRKSVGFCPEGLTACSISGKGDDYECLDISADIDSCGGCLHGQFGASNLGQSKLGVNCGELGAALGSYTCEKGSCKVFKCAPGLELVDGSCV